MQTPIFRAAGLEVVALYSRRLDKAQKMCDQMGIAHAFDSIEDLCSCPDVQIVSVTSPTYLHAEHAIAALKAGKHVLSDKPGGANVAEVEAMVKEASSRPGQFAIIDHEMRFTAAVQAARKAILDVHAGMMTSGKGGSVTNGGVSAQVLQDPSRRLPRDVLLLANSAAFEVFAAATRQVR